MEAVSPRTNLDKEQIFNTKREELLGLLDRADEIVDRLSKTGYFSSVSKDLGTQINATRQRCHEGLFSIALIAAFQSGKSTTLNAFADGREIAPRGLGGGGVKTSACLVKVQNPNKGEEETVKVTWRSEKDLQQGLEDALGTTARSQVDSQTAINFRTAQGRALLEQALKIELGIYSQSDRKGSPEMQDKEDLLRFAMIVLAYHDHPALKNLKQRKNFEPEEMESYLKFPKDFTDKWNQCFENLSQPLNQTKRKFALKEVIYAFIKDVTYIVESENLKKSGAEIVDCPGLLASKFDTDIASEAMQEASAIWFLLTADKSLSQSDKSVLSRIKEIGVQKKVFFGINYKRPIKKDEEGKVNEPVIGEIFKELRKLGFTASYQLEPLYFNAFLSLRAMQGEKLLRHSLDSSSQQQIILDAEAMLGEEFDSVEEAWLESVIEVMTNVVVGRKERRKIDSLEFDAETVEFVREKSQWDSATSEIKDYIFKTKAWSMLVDFGCEPIIKTLEQAKDSLKIQEDIADKNRESAQQEWNEASEKLHLFTQESQIIITDYIDDNWDLVLAKSFWHEVCIPALQLTGKSAAPKVLDETGVLKGLGDLGNRFFNLFKEEKDKEKVTAERVGNIIKKELEDCLNQKSQGWFNSLKENGNHDYQEQILKRLQRACEQLQKKWQDLNLDNNSYLRGLDVNIPQFSGDLRRDLEKYNEAGFDSAVDGAISEGYFASWKTYITGVFSLMMIDLLVPGIGIILTAIVVAIIGFFAVWKPREERIKNISKKITEGLDKGFKANRDDISDKLQEKLSIIRKSYLGAMNQSFENMNKQLNQRIDDAKAIFASSQAEIKRIAGEANKFRTQEIEPLQEKMEQFQSSVEGIWPISKPGTDYSKRSQKSDHSKQSQQSDYQSDHRRLIIQSDRRSQII